MLAPLLHGFLEGREIDTDQENGFLELRKVFQGTPWNRNTFYSAILPSPNAGQGTS